jgi:hypothetical protein
MSLTYTSDVEDVIVWLKSLPADYSKYHEAFRANKIDGMCLLSLSVDDLFQRLGIVSVGHRHILRKQLSNVSTTTSAPKQAASSTSASLAKSNAVIQSPSLPKPVGSLARASHKNAVLSQQGSDWLVLKEGSLLKTKIVKGIHKSTKLRWVVLKQNPLTRDLRLEYYDGKILKGVANLVGATVLAKTEGEFDIRTTDRTFYFQTEKRNLHAAMSWVVTIQAAVSGIVNLTSKRTSAASRRVKVSSDGANEHVDPGLLPCVQRYDFLLAD